MIAASTLAIFIVPVLFVIITRFSYGKEKLAYLQAHQKDLQEKAEKVEAENIDPELEYDIQHARERHEEEHGTKTDNVNNDKKDDKNKDKKDDDPGIAY